MKICLYSAVNDKCLFKQVGFYRDDIKALSLRGDKVIATNSILELLKFRPELVVGYFYSKSILAVLVSRLMGSRVILTGGADQISPVLMSGYKLFIRRAVAVLCLWFSHRILLSCTDDVANYLRLCFGVRSLQRKIELVRHVVTPAIQPDEPRIPIDGKFHAFTLCWMGSEGNVRRKGVDTAIKLIANLRKLGINAYLDVAGADGPGKTLLENLANELNVTKYIRFLGRISEAEKNQYFANGTVYLQLSEHEGFGVAAAEAFFSGMIVVHSNKGGLRDVIGEYGIIIDPKEIDENDLSWGRKFYSKFLRHRSDLNFLSDNLERYSVRIRSDAFLGEFDV